jgi:cytochrome c oxidase subunit IV
MREESRDNIYADVKKHVHVYALVFASLVALTALTVTISRFHLNVVPAVVAALTIASIKGSIVAKYFMHVVSEKKIIYGVLIVSSIFFLSLMFLPVLAFSDAVR